MDLKELFIKLRVAITGKDGVDKLNDKLGGIKSGASGVIKSLGAISAAGVGLYGTLFKLTTNFSDYADELGKASSKANMNSDSLQRWAKVAKINDISFESLTGMLSKFNINVGKGSQGNKEITKTFNALGVSLKNTDGSLKTNDQLFSETVDHLNQIPNKSERAAMAVSLFGRGAAQLAPVLDMTGEELNKLWLQKPPFDDEKLAAGQKFDDQMKVLKGTISRVALEIGSKLLPMFSNLVGRIQTWFTANKKLIDQKLDNIITQVSKAIDKLLNANWTTFFDGVSKVSGVLFDMINWVMGNLPLVTTTIGVFIGAFAVTKVAGVLSSLSSITTALTGIKGGVTQLAAVGAFWVGWKLGTWLDELLGASDAISDLLFKMDKADREKQKRLNPNMDNNQGAGQSAAIDQGQNLINLYKSGIKSVEGPNGQRQELNPSTIMDIVKGSKSYQGLNEDMKQGVGYQVQKAIESQIVNNITLNISGEVSQGQTRQITEAVKNAVRQAMPNAAR